MLSMDMYLGREWEGITSLLYNISRVYRLPAWTVAISRSRLNRT